MSLGTDGDFAQVAAEAPEETSEVSTSAAFKALQLVTTEGRNLQVGIAVDPVMDLRAGATAGHRVEAHINDMGSGRDLASIERRNLLPRDFAAIDATVMDRSLAVLAEREGQGAPRLIIQLSFASLSNSRIRTALIARAGARDQLLKQGAICEIGDVENGIPITRLMELNALVRPFFRGVWMQVQPSRGLIETAKSARINGLSVRAWDLGEGASGVARGLRAFMALANNASQVLTVTGLPNADMGVEAMASGFTHATVQA